jgi:hypothetical protein
MKFSRLLLICAFAGMTLAGARARSTDSATPASDKSKTNAAPVELPLPLGTFDLKAAPTKDPFFPLSTRQPVPQATNAAPAFTSGAFMLKGLSGHAGERLALINNRTVAAGESAEITTAFGHVKIHCIRIKENSVVIRAESQPDEIEVFLRKAAQ